MTLLEKSFFFLLVWLTAYGLLGVGLGNLGVFRPGLVLLASGLAAFFLSLTPRVGPGVKRRGRLPKSDLVVWLALPLMALLFFPPFEYIFGGRDPGVYVAVGAGLAREGRLRSVDEQIASLSRSDRQFYYRLRGKEGNKQWGDSYRKNRQYPGLFVTDSERGEVTPQFYPLYPVLLAAGYFAGGPIGELAVTPFLTILALAAVYLFGREVFSSRVAVWSFILILISYPVLWYSRYPNSELPTTLFLFGGAWLFCLAWRRRLISLSLLSAVIVGAALLLRIDTILLLFPLLLLLAGGGRREERRLIKAFVLALAPFLVFWLVEGWYFSRPYFTHVVLGENPGRLWTAIGAAVLAPVLFAAAPPLSRIGFKRIFGRFHKLLVELTGMGLFVFIITLQISGFIAPTISDLANLLKLEWYLTPPVVLIGFWGVWRLLTRRWREPPVRFVFGYALFVSLFYLYKARVTPVHPWWVRRFLPVAIPALVIAFVWMIAGWSARWGRFLRIFVFGFTAAVYLAISVSMVRFDLFRGGLRLLDYTASVLPAEALVVADDDWGVLATPLYYLYGRRVVPLNPDQPPEIRLQALVRAGSAFPGRRLWYYSFRESEDENLLPSRLSLIAERNFQARGYQSARSLPVAPGKIESTPLRIYWQTDLSIPK
jgi:4-amino-4-deoxy-L-arabinose transferase-like glycosyltransferase